MPQELLSATPLYVFVGIYRLLADKKLWHPIYLKSYGAFKKGAFVAALWLPLAYFPTNFFVKYFAKPVQLAKWQDDAQFLHINIQHLATVMFVLGQASAILHYFLSSELRHARAHVYEATIHSRSKSAEFWIPYVEEWKEPPTERAKRSLEKADWYAKLGTTWMRLLVVRVLLLPIAFIPFLTTLVTAYLRSLTLAKTLHTPYFDLKKMSPYERELFLVERQFEFRAFGFTAALLERLPILGLVFSISNRVAAAMWCHDLEKRQHAYRDGTLKPTKVYVSKTALIPPSDIPDAPGSFPNRKHPIRPASADTPKLKVLGKDL